MYSPRIDSHHAENFTTVFLKNRTSIDCAEESGIYKKSALLNRSWVMQQIDWGIGLRTTGELLHFVEKWRRSRFCNRGQLSNPSSIMIKS